MKYYNYKRMSCGQGGAGTVAGGRGVLRGSGFQGGGRNGATSAKHQAVQIVTLACSLSFSFAVSVSVSLAVSFCSSVGSVFLPLGPSESPNPPVRNTRSQLLPLLLLLLLLQSQHVGTLCLYGRLPAKAVADNLDALAVISLENRFQCFQHVRCGNS